MDKAKITLVKGVHSFLGHVGFYRQFIRDFSKISRPLSALLMQGVLIRATVG